jgi:hypothetical protein
MSGGVTGFLGAAGFIGSMARWNTPVMYDSTGLEIAWGRGHEVEIGLGATLHCFLRTLTGGEMAHARETRPD